MNNKLVVQVLLGTVLLLIGVILGLLLREPTVQNTANHSQDYDQMPSQAGPGHPKGGAENRDQQIILPETVKTSEIIANLDGLNGFSFYMQNKKGGMLLLESCTAQTYVNK